MSNQKTVENALQYSIDENNTDRNFRVAFKEEVFKNVFLNNKILETLKDQPIEAVYIIINHLLNVLLTSPNGSIYLSDKITKVMEIGNNMLTLYYEPIEGITYRNNEVHWGSKNKEYTITFNYVRKIGNKVTTTVMDITITNPKWLGIN